MIKSWLIVILLFLASLCGFMGWYSEFAQYYELKHAKVADATAVSTSQKPGRVSEWSAHRIEYPLRFTTESGKSIRAEAYVPKRVIDALQQGGTAKVLYLPERPERVRFQEDLDEMPRGWSYLLFGIAALIVAIVTMRHRYAMSRYTKYLGRGDGGGDDD